MMGRIFCLVFIFYTIHFFTFLLMVRLCFEIRNKKNMG